MKFLKDIYLSWFKCIGKCIICKKYYPNNDLYFYDSGRICLSCDAKRIINPIDNKKKRYKKQLSLCKKLNKKI